MIKYLCEMGLRQVTHGLVMLQSPNTDTMPPLVDALRMIAQDAGQIDRTVLRRAASQAEEAARQFMLGGADGDHLLCVRALLDLGQVLLSALAAEAEHRAEKSQVGTPRLLVVDDSRVAAVALSKAFSAQGFLVRSVATMVDALAELSLFQPCVLISDVHMPDLDVGVLSRVFRTLSRGRSSLVVLVSGTTGPELEARIAEVRPDGFVSKTSGTNPVVECVMQLWKKVAGSSSLGCGPGCSE